MVTTRHNGYMTTTTRHFSDDNGALCCEKHAGAYLTASIKQKPKAKTYKTPLGTYMEVTQDDVAFFIAEFGYACETCTHNV